MYAKFKLPDGQKRIEYPGGIENWCSTEIIEIDNQRYIAGRWNGGEALPDGVEAHEPPPEDSVVEVTTTLPVDKIRFLDLLGSAAVAFKAAIRDPNTPPLIAAQLDVAQEYLNKAPEPLDLQSSRIQMFLGQLNQAGILTAEDVVRISANQTAEEAAAVTA